METRTDYNSWSMRALKGECKKQGWEGFTKYKKKKDLVMFCLSAAESKQTLPPKNILKTKTDTNEMVDGESKNVAEPPALKIFPLKFLKTDDPKDFKFYEPVEGYKIKEFIDMTRLNHIVNSASQLPVDETSEKMKTWLKYGKLSSIKQFHESILIHTTEEEQILNPRFFKSNKYELINDDRIYPVANRSLSHMGDRRFPLRSFMMKYNGYQDCDITNCQPNCVRSLMKYAGVEESKWVSINEYCEKRDEMKTRVPELKSICISILNGGTDWLLDTELSLKENQDVADLMSAVGKELNTHIIPILKELYPSLHNPKLNKGYKKKSKYADDNHLFLGNVLRQMEYRLLCFSFTLMKTRKIITQNECYAIPSHDGFYFHTPQLVKMGKDKDYFQKFIGELNLFCKKMLGLDFIEWRLKPFKNTMVLPEQFRTEWDNIEKSKIQYKSRLKEMYGNTKEQIWEKLKDQGSLYSKQYTEMFLAKNQDLYVVVKGEKDFDRCLTRNEFGLLTDVKDTKLEMDVREHFDYLRRIVREHYQSDTDWDLVMNMSKLPLYLKQDKDFMRIFNKCHDSEKPVRNMEMLFGNLSCAGVSFGTIHKLIKKEMVDVNFHKEVNNNPWVLGFTNGVFDLKTGKLRNATPEDKQVFTTGYKFEYSGAREEIVRGIEDRLKTIFCDKNGKYNEDKYTWVMEEFGKCLCGNQLDLWGEYFLNLFGSGGNGKSALQESFIGSAFGNYCQEIPTKLLNEEHTTRSPELMRLVNARFIIINEPDAHEKGGCRTNTIKKYTGGTISIRDNFAKADEVEQVRLERAWMAMNKPMKYKIQKDLEAMKRRMRGVHLYRNFTDDPMKHDEKNPLSILSTPEDKEFILKCKNDIHYKSEMIYILWERLRDFMKKSAEDQMKLPKIIADETDDFIEQSIYGNDEYNFIRKATQEEIKKGKGYAIDIRSIRTLVNKKTNKSYALRTVQDWLNSNYGVMTYQKHNMAMSSRYSGDADICGNMVDKEDNVLSDGQITGFTGKCNKYIMSWVRKRRKCIVGVILKDEEGEYLPVWEIKNILKTEIVGFEYVKTGEEWIGGRDKIKKTKQNIKLKDKGVKAKMI